MGGARLELRSVTKRFGEVVAVQGLSLDVPGGAFVTLLGPSGCGKTTTLNMIAGFETPDEGEIFLDGEPITSLPPHRRPVNTVFQGYALFPHLDVYDNAAFGLRMRRLPRHEVDRRVRRALQIVRLEGLERRRPAELSGGQQQRVALARAFVNEPKVLLLDEPLSALDAELRKRMQLELKALQRELGITFVYVTHDQEEALVMSDVICVMDAGACQQVGAPRELYERPATRFVARFLGKNNFFEGTIRRVGDGSALDLGRGRVIRLAEDIPEGRATVAVRPEHLQLCRGPEDENVLRGVVDELRFLGDRTEATVRVDDDLRLTAYADGLRLAPGDPVAVSVPPDRCHVVEGP